MRPVILFVVGAPGVGKTTLVRGLLGGPAHLFTEPPEPKWTIAATPGDRFTAGRTRAVAAGWYKGEVFDGGDTVPYSGARAALEFWANELLPLSPLTIFDGARFSTGPALAYVSATADARGAAMVGVHLVASDDELVARRAGRGSNQSPSWIKGAATSARHFAHKIGAIAIRAGDPPDVLRQVRALIDKATE